MRTGRRKRVLRLCRAALAAEFALFSMACSRGPEQPRPSFSDEKARSLVEEAVEKAGGWERWRSFRDVSFVSTLNLYDSVGTRTSSTSFFHRALLHQGLRCRVESIGRPDEIVFGFDRGESWFLHDGRPVEDTFGSAFGRFDAASGVFWLGLPFSILESRAAVRYAGESREGARRWEKVEVRYAEEPAVPVDWAVLYLDPRTLLVRRVHARVRAAFLPHRLWVAKWRDIRNWQGILVARRRTYFPADAEGNIVGTMAAEHLIEHVEFDRGYPEELFRKPLVAGGGSPAA
ncbi:MAG: hypothetical protein KatS3mg076_1298 [Candidatus Binatia bacterium]|nr:MAG: hypothetical protein KatS3mg076_1298 [Candidatus Binatia bacterium]